MLRHAIVTAIVLGLAAAGGAQAADSHTHHLQCNYNSDYDVQIKPDGIAFTRDHGHPGDVFIHDGQLRVDGRATPVSAEDAARLREYEQHVRELLPAMALIARDGVDIGYSALTTVVATLADNGDERTRMLQELRDRHTDALQQIDGSLGHGFWKAGDDGEAFGDNMQRTVADLVGNVTRDVVRDALSGDPNKLAALQARTDALDATIDKAVDAPANKLAQRAEALCPQFGELERLQQQFQFRLSDGGRLQLLTTDMDGSNKASQYAER
ncbi:hypothetical protein GCM10007862_31330 [Dyella lipolytica]|uniref:DUF2884 family protein n=1 Tax=Dyella lipolytica TaxID=1867835 RepID=A0ABW8IWE8_9GAMM|nr:DUF2884 family protein [Dyella lipolytica]GLQ48082.1 hypothetical protein GCM10007862_31330 [Dyella lipolytica]